MTKSVASSSIRPVHLRIGRKSQRKPERPRMAGGYRPLSILEQIFGGLVVMRPAKIYFGCFRCSACRRWVGKGDLVYIAIGRQPEELYHWVHPELLIPCGPVYPRGVDSSGEVEAARAG